MARFGFKLKIRQGTAEEYKRRHQAVHGELLAAFEAYGITTYSIFIDGTTLFAYMEAPNVQEVLSKLGDTPANTRWQQFMSDILVQDEDGRTMEPLEEVFFFVPDGEKGQA